MSINVAHFQGMPVREKRPVESKQGGFTPAMTPTRGWVLPTAAERLVFGRRPYGDLFGSVRLTPAQRPLASGLLELDQATSLADLQTHLTLLHHPQYAGLTHLKGRLPSHSPFVALFFRLNHPTQQLRLMRALEQTARHHASPTAQGNALAELANLYFFGLRPGGEAEKRWGESFLGRKRHALLQHQLLKTFKSLNEPVLRDLLRYRWLEVANIRFWQGAGFYEAFVPQPAFERMEAQLMPLVNHPVREPVARPMLAPAALRKQLEAALESPDIAPLRRMSEDGSLTRLIPEWSRLMGPDNAQHDGQDHTLLEHCLQVTAGAKASPWYQTLSVPEKRLVSIAALLHDVGKKSGPPNLRSLIPIDREHPLRSADIARQVLPALGFTPDETERVARLILDHTLLGSMNMRSELMPSPAVLEQGALRLRHPAMLPMLQALTEGDIRGVKRDGVLYTPAVEEKLENISAAIALRVRRNLESGFYLPRTDWSALLKAQTHASAQKSVEIRIPAHMDEPWMVLPLERLMDPRALHRSFLEHPLYEMSWLKTRDLAASALPFGVMVDVLPEDVVLASKRPLGEASALNAQAGTLAEILSERSERPEVRAVIQRRREERQRYAALAARHGFSGWGEALSFLLREELNPVRSAKYDAMLQDLQARQQLGAGTSTLQMLAVRPRVKAVYAVQKPGTRLSQKDLPPALRELMIAQGLPLVIVES